MAGLGGGKGKGRGASGRWRGVGSMDLAWAPLVRAGANAPKQELFVTTCCGGCRTGRGKMRIGVCTLTRNPRAVSNALLPRLPPNRTGPEQLLDYNMGKTASQTYLLN